MGKTWVLDTETKGTGANMVPLEKLHGEQEPRRARRGPGKGAGAPTRSERRRTPPKPEPVRSATTLPPGHVRKRATGEIGKVRSVDAKAGTAVVHWLKAGATSTVPLSALSRR